MQRFEYKVIAAPRRGERARGAKTTSERFALTLSVLMNQMGGDGWEYVRADTLPCDERAGLTGKTTTYQTIMVFRREAATAAAPADVPYLLSAPQPATPRLDARADRLDGYDGATAPKLGPAGSRDVAGEDLAAE